MLRCGFFYQSFGNVNSIDLFLFGLINMIYLNSTYRHHSIRHLLSQGSAVNTNGSLAFLIKGNVTQLVECQFEELVADGSIPSISTIIGICNRFFTKSFANIDKQKSGVPAGRGIESFTQRSLNKGEKSGGYVFTFHNPRLARILKLTSNLFRLKFRYSSNLRNFEHFVKKFIEA